MSEADRNFYLRVLQVQFSQMSKRERRRMWRRHRLLHIALDRLSKEIR